VATAQRAHARPDPRIAQTRQLVLEATFALIAEAGFAGATVERIAERSGVARSSIYRHWPNPLPALHMEALTPLRERPEDITRTGDPRTDVLSYLHHVVDRLNDRAYATATLALLSIANTDATYSHAHRELLATRTALLDELLREAVDAHALCRCTDIGFEARMLLAPLTHLRFVEHRAVDREFAGRLADRLFALCAPDGPACTCPPASVTRHRKATR
jgi:AcrR family transcriptional regulator